MASKTFAQMFKVSTVTKPTSSQSAKNPKDAFLMALTKQKGYAEAYASGNPPQQGNGKRLNTMFWQRNGVHFITLKYGIQNLDLDGKGNATIEAGQTWKDLVDTLESVINTVKTSDVLDKAIIDAAVIMSKRMASARDKK